MSESSANASSVIPGLDGTFTGTSVATDSAKTEPNEPQSTVGFKTCVTRVSCRMCCVNNKFILVP